MKLVCDCGNEMDFNEIDKTTGEKHDVPNQDGDQYTTLDGSKFESWAAHDEAGFACRKCKKAIWYFT